MILAALAIGLIFFAPNEYMLQIPDSLGTVLHPWILGLVALISGVLGVSGLIGSVVARLVTTKPNER